MVIVSHSAVRFHSTLNAQGCRYAAMHKQGFIMPALAGA